MKSNKHKIIALVILAQTSLISEGGISGGGGLVLNPTPPQYAQNPEFAKNLIENSFIILQNFVQKKKQQLSSGTLSTRENDLYKKLFPKEKLNIENVLTNVKVHIETQKPCYTYDGLPVDGSINSNEYGTICISSKTFADKVHYNEIQKQATALALHEYSEVTGLTDSEAIELQTLALSEIY